MIIHKSLFEPRFVKNTFKYKCLVRALMCVRHTVRRGTTLITSISFKVSAQTKCGPLVIRWLRKTAIGRLDNG